MAAVAAAVPGRVTRRALHGLGSVRKPVFAPDRPDGAVFAQTHRPPRLPVVRRVCGVDRIQDLLDLPGETLRHFRVLDDPGSPPLHPRLAERRLLLREVAAAREPRRDQRGALGRRTMAVPAADLDDIPHLRVELAVAAAVTVGGPVAIDALHALLDVNVLEVDRLLEPIGIGIRNELVGRVEEPAVAVPLVDPHEVPPMPVGVAELDMPHLRVVPGELGHLRRAVGGQDVLVRRIHAEDPLVGVPPRIAHPELHHAVVVGFLVPPEIALVHRQRAVALVMMARDAL